MIERGDNESYQSMYYSLIPDFFPLSPGMGSKKGDIIDENTIQRNILSLLEG